MRCTIDRIEGDRAILRTDDGQELIVPRGALPDGVGEGSILTATFRSDAAATEDRAAQARMILDELLGMD